MDEKEGNSRRKTVYKGPEVKDCLARPGKS